MKKIVTVLTILVAVSITTIESRAAETVEDPTLAQTTCVKEIGGQEYRLTEGSERNAFASVFTVRICPIGAACTPDIWTIASKHRKSDSWDVEPGPASALTEAAAQNHLKDFETDCGLKSH